MKTIAVIGDSHVWGEGVGAERRFVPPVCCGDLRPLPFDPPSYVNLLRTAVNAATASSVSEYEGEPLFTLCGGREGPCGVVENIPLVIEGDFSLARVFIHAEAETASLELIADTDEGEIRVTHLLDGGSPAINASLRVLQVTMPDGQEAHKLTVRLGEGKRALVYRVELYSGAYAVVNCGIGSCPVGLFADTYFDRYITPLKPYAILFEGCTINDWLRTSTPEVYAADLRRMLTAQRALTDRLLWHTVFPITGNRVSSLGGTYDAYVDAMRSVAQDEGIPLVDCNAEVSALLSMLPEEERDTRLFHDPWHPSGEGHRLYADLIRPELTKLF